MAEEGREYEGQLQSLLSRYSSEDVRADSKGFCSDFCKLVEEHASRWQVPLPRLRILEKSLRSFTQASSFFTSNCDHVLHTLSSLALSVFESLLFFDQNTYHEEPLKQFAVTFQECYLTLARHQNVHLLQVERLVRGGGPWASSVLQAILSESSLPQSEVDGYISSELPVFFELRVRYLLSCEQRVGEAVALAKCCSRHPTAGQHSFFLQVYLTWLLKTSQHERLHREVADLNSKHAVHIICSLECEEKDDLLLVLCKAFLAQQLRKGDMYYLCDLVFVWSKLHSRLKTSKKSLLEETHHLMLSATNVNSVFPFIRAIMQEVGEDGIQLCVELCAKALESCLPCDVITKSLIYKTIAGLLPNDLEVCRACALLVFFLERSVEAYKMVYLLYLLPDQEYHVDSSPIKNHIRFETLQVLKKDLYFDPEFWNLITLRTNCLKLMKEKVVSTALEEIMEDKWILKYCTKDSVFWANTSVCQKGNKRVLHVSSKKRQHQDQTDSAAKRMKVGPGRTRLNNDHTKKKRNQGSRSFRNESSKPLRRSFWQLDRLHDNGDHRRTTRLSDKISSKRRIRTPRWLLEDSGTLDQNKRRSKIRKHGLQHRGHNQSALKRTENAQIKNDAKHKPSVNSHLLTTENKHLEGLSLDKPANPPQVILELSLPDNELMGTFTDDTSNRQRGLPQVLLYKRTVKLPDSPQPAKNLYGKEVILRARDSAMLVQLVHCYSRRQKGKGNGLNMQGSVSTITRSSAQGSPPKESPRKLFAETRSGIITRTKLRETFGKVPQGRPTKTVLRKASSAKDLSEKSSVERKHTNVSRMSSGTELKQVQRLDKVLQGKAPTKELCEGSAVEMKVTIASQTPAAKATSNEVSRTSNVDKSQTESTKECLRTTATDQTTSQSEGVPGRLSSKAETDNYLVSRAKSDTPGLITNLSKGVLNTGVKDNPSKEQTLSENGTSLLGTVATQARTKGSPKPTNQGSMNDISALTLVTEMVTEMAPGSITRNKDSEKPPLQEGTAPRVSSKVGGKLKSPLKVHTTSRVQAPSPVADTQGNKACDVDAEDSEPERETEESRLEYCCTFCKKDFKGSRVVAHAMFHYRKDECMFCGIIFKDDLLAMMHLSDHIEKLKRIKDTSGNKMHVKRRERRVSETKEKPTLKTSPTSISPQRRSIGRPKKSTTHPSSASSPDSTPSGSRRLRSSESAVDVPLVQDKKPKGSKSIDSKTPVHKVNGHIGLKRKPGRPRKIHLNSERISERTRGTTQSLRLKEKEVETDSSASVQVVKKVGRPPKKRMGRPRAIPLSMNEAQESSADRSLSFRLRENKDTKVDSPAIAPVVKKLGRPPKKKLGRPRKIPLNSERTQETTEDEAHGPRLKGNKDEKVDSAALGLGVKRKGRPPKNKLKRLLQLQKTVTQQDVKTVTEKNLEPHEKLCCPVDDCSWYTDLAKNRVGLLYHAFEAHYGEVKPLKLAYRIGNSKCSVCMRVLWSFEHFIHHIEQHRLTPRYPCPHQGCPARFKTGMEMRRHARKHSPLQAACCLPDCSKLFICLWALNLHEREHYAASPTKPVKNVNKLTGDKHKKESEHLSEDVSSTTTLNQTVAFKAAQKLRRLNRHNMSAHKRVTAPPRTSLRSSLSEQQIKVNSDRTQGSNIPNNLSNTGTSKSSGPNQRLRRIWCKALPQPSLRPHEITSSALINQDIKVRHEFMEKQVQVTAKRRGRPPKAEKAAHRENTTTGSALEKNQSTDQTKKVAEAESKEVKKQDGPWADRRRENLKSKSIRLMKNQFKRNHRRQRRIHYKTRLRQSFATTSTDQTTKSTKLNQSIETPSANKPKISTNLNQPSATPTADKTKKSTSCNQSVATASANKTRKSVSQTKSVATNSVDTTKSTRLSQPVATTSVDRLKTTSLNQSVATASTKDTTSPCSGQTAATTLEDNTVSILLDQLVAAASAEITQNSTSFDQSVATTPNEKPKSTSLTATTPPDITKRPSSSNPSIATTSPDMKKKSFLDKMKELIQAKKPSTASQRQTASLNSAKSKEEEKNPNTDAKTDILEKVTPGQEADASPEIESKSSKTNLKKGPKSKESLKTKAAVESNEGQAKDKNVAVDHSLSTMPAATANSTNETSLPGTGTKTEKATKPRVKKSLDSNKEKKRKVKEGDTRIVKKKSKDPSEPEKLKKLKIKVQTTVEEKTEGIEGSQEVKSSEERPQMAVNVPGYSKITNAHQVDEQLKAKQFKQTLAEYGKRPYMRAPPEAYLDEKYITMPKRRKEMTVLPQRISLPEKAKVPAALQRQRCTDCFATFNSAEELQSHRQLQRCSKLFGFDSDDEGNS